MLRRTLLLAAVAALGATLAPLATSRQSVTTLRAVVGPGFTIYVANEAGDPVARVDPGEYRIVVDDRATDHNFRLTGPGVNMATGVEFVGSVTWNVTLTEGLYRFVCDPHSASMRGTLTVGNPAPTTTAPAPRPLAPGRLIATVGPGHTITLMRGRTRVRALRPGRYTITVRDRSRVHNFHLVGPGVNRKTTVAFVGTARWIVRVRRGTYVFRCDPHARHMRGVFRVR